MITDSTISLLRELEGVRYTMYRDSAGLPTIGVGHLINQKLEAGLNTQTLNDVQVNALLSKDMDEEANCIQSVIHVPLSQNQYDALMALVFNIGVGSFSSSTVAKAINSGANQDYITQWWICWDKEHRDGQLIEDLSLKDRRQKEIGLFFKLLNT